MLRRLTIPMITLGKMKHNQLRKNKQKKHPFCDINCHKRDAFIMRFDYFSFLVSASYILNKLATASLSVVSLTDSP